MNLLLSSATPLEVTDAVGGIITVGEKYLMQRRDARADIWYPDHWGLFGGVIEPGEDSLTTLARELDEELELKIDLSVVQLFLRLNFEPAGLRLGIYRRDIYTIPIAADRLGQLVLHEGAELGLFSPEEMLGAMRITPLDSFAIFLHVAQRRLLPRK